MSNRDIEILTLWKTLSEREKQKVLKKLKARAEQESKPKRQLRPIWRFAFDTLNVLGTLAILYVLIVATLIIA